MVNFSNTIIYILIIILIHLNLINNICNFVSFIVFKEHYNSVGERDVTEILIFWILAMIVYLVLLYFNFGLINQNTVNN